jgi:hypothetical protein
VLSQNKTYADSVKNIHEAVTSQPIQTETKDLRKIIKDAKNEELAEETDKKSRSCNIILHGLRECIGDDAKGTDEAYVKSFLETLKTSATTYKSIFRLGKQDPNKKRPRPIKLIMKSEDDKKNIMDNLKHLKDQEMFKGLSVADDHTISERQLIKEYTEQAKESNQNESPNSKYIWKVRGEPKNGLRVKRFLKRQPVIPQA